MSKIIQKDKVLNYLKTHDSLTVREAMLDLNINSLPKRIEELRKEGYLISTNWITTDSGSRYGVYKLEAERCILSDFQVFKA